VTDCLFCRIIAGEVAAHVVLDTPDAFAFLDHRPVFKGHTIVVPREHVVTLTDLPEPAVGPFFVAVQRVAGAVVAGLGADGSFVANNNVVSQSVAHLHVHVVPRRRKDGLRGFFWPRVKYDDDEEAAAFAASIATALDA
jgi:histidine triad (HIT) family protein